MNKRTAERYNAPPFILLIENLPHCGAKKKRTLIFPAVLDTERIVPPVVAGRRFYPAISGSGATKQSKRKPSRNPTPTESFHLGIDCFADKLSRNDERAMTEPPRITSRLAKTLPRSFARFRRVCGSVAICAVGRFFFTVRFAVSDESRYPRFLVY